MSAVEGDNKYFNNFARANERDGQNVSVSVSWAGLLVYFFFGETKQGSHSTGTFARALGGRLHQNSD